MRHPARCGDVIKGAHPGNSELDAMVKELMPACSQKIAQFVFVDKVWGYAVGHFPFDQFKALSKR